MSELRKIPNVGKKTEHNLIAMGYTTINSLKGKKAEELYAEECDLHKCIIDRCQLYLYRAVEYFVNSKNPEPKKFKWWHWKDEYVLPSPCGAVCVECNSFPDECAGCHSIKGKVFWIKYTGDKCCNIYNCCIEDKKLNNCSTCKDLPCNRFINDPTITNEQNAENLKKQLNNLSKKLI